MKHPNINLNNRPEGMSIGQAAEVLRDQREKTRQEMLFGLAVAMAPNKEFAERAMIEPYTAARELSEFVEALLCRAYCDGLSTVVDPTQILAVEIAEEHQKAMEEQDAVDFWAEPREYDHALDAGCPHVAPGGPGGARCSKPSCDGPGSCEHRSEA